MQKRQQTLPYRWSSKTAYLLSSISYPHPHPMALKLLCQLYYKMWGFDFKLKVARSGMDLDPLLRNRWLGVLRLFCWKLGFLLLRPAECFSLLLQARLVARVEELQLLITRSTVNSLWGDQLFLWHPPCLSPPTQCIMGAKKPSSLNWQHQETKWRKSSISLPTASHQLAVNSLDLFCPPVGYPEMVQSLYNRRQKPTGLIANLHTFFMKCWKFQLAQPWLSSCAYCVLQPIMSIIVSFLSLPWLIGIRHRL